MKIIGSFLFFLGLLLISVTLQAQTELKLVPGSSTAEQGFGFSVSLSGDYALVGAPIANEGAGAAYIFRRSGGNWDQQATLMAADGIPGDSFGFSVSKFLVYR